MIIDILINLGIRSMSLGLNNDLMASVGQLTKDPKYADQKLITSKNEAGKLHLEAILDVLTSQLQSGHVESRVGSLKWIRHLFTIVNPFMVNYVDKIFPVLLKTLSDSTDEVVIIDIQVLSVICKPNTNSGASASASPSCDQENKFFKALLGCLIAMFKADKSLLTGKGPYIVRLEITKCLMKFHTLKTVFFLFQATLRFAQLRGHL